MAEIESSLSSPGDEAGSVSSTSVVTVTQSNHNAAPITPSTPVRPIGFEVGAVSCSGSVGLLTRSATRSGKEYKGSPTRRPRRTATFLPSRDPTLYDLGYGLAVEDNTPPGPQNLRYGAEIRRNLNRAYMPKIKRWEDPNLVASKPNNDFGFDPPDSKSIAKLNQQNLVTDQGRSQPTVPSNNPRSSQSPPQDSMNSIAKFKMSRQNPTADRKGLEQLQAPNNPGSNQTALQASIDVAMDSSMNRQNPTAAQGEAQPAVVVSTPTSTHSAPQIFINDEMDFETDTSTAGPLFDDSWVLPNVDLSLPLPDVEMSATMQNNFDVEFGTAQPLGQINNRFAPAGSYQGPIGTPGNPEFEFSDVFSDVQPNPFHNNQVSGQASQQSSMSLQQQSGSPVTPTRSNTRLLSHNSPGMDFGGWPTIGGNETRRTLFSSPESARSPSTRMAARPTNRRLTYASPQTENQSQGSAVSSPLSVDAIDKLMMPPPPTPSTQRSSEPRSSEATGNLESSLSNNPDRSLEPERRTRPVFTDDPFVNFINLDTYDSTGAGLNTSSAYTAIQSARTSFGEPVTPSFADVALPTTQPIDLELGHTYPPVWSYHDNEYRTRAQLDELRRITDPNFRDDENWGNAFHTSDQILPLESTQDIAKELRNKDWPAIHRAMRNNAAARFPEVGLNDMRQNSFKQASRNINGPSQVEVAKKSQQQRWDYAKTAQNFREKPVLLADGRQLNGIQGMILNMRDTLSRPEDVASDGDFMAFAAGANFLLGRALPEPQLPTTQLPDELEVDPAAATTFSGNFMDFNNSGNLIPAGAVPRTEETLVQRKQDDFEADPADNKEREDRKAHTLALLKYAQHPAGRLMTYHQNQERWARFPQLPTSGAMQYQNQTTPRKRVFSEANPVGTSGPFDSSVRPLTPGSRSPLKRIQMGTAQLEHALRRDSPLQSSPTTGYGRFATQSPGAIFSAMPQGSPEQRSSVVAPGMTMQCPISMASPRFQGLSGPLHPSIVPGRTLMQSAGPVVSLDAHGYRSYSSPAMMGLEMTRDQGLMVSPNIHSHSGYGVPSLTSGRTTQNPGPSTASGAQGRSEQDTSSWNPASVRMMSRGPECLPMDTSGPVRGYPAGALSWPGRPQHPGTEVPAQYRRAPTHQTAGDIFAESIRGTPEI